MMSTSCDRPLRIAVLSLLGVGDPRKGGSEVHAYEVGEALAARLHTVMYLHVPPKATPKLMEDYTIPMPLPRRRGWAFPNYYLYNFLAFLKLLKLRPDAIITSNFNFAASLCRLLQGTIVVAIFYQLGYRPLTGTTALERWRLQDSSWKNALRGLLQYIHNESPIRAVRHDAIVTLSGYAARVCRSLRGKTPPQSILALGTGVDVCNCKPQPKQFDVCCLTRLVSYKRVDVLIDALRILKNRDIRCAIVGDGEEKENLERRAQGLSAAFPGWLEGEAKHRILSSSRIFCLPSPLEGFGIVFLEAMAHRLPVVYCNLPPMNEELKGYGFPFRNGDASSLAEALAHLLDNPELIRTYGEKGYSRILEENIWSSVAARYEATLNKLLHTA